MFRPEPLRLRHHLWLAVGTVLLLSACSNHAVADSSSMTRVASAPAQVDPAPADRPLRAAFVVVDGVYNTELMAPYDIFHHTPHHTKPKPGIEVYTVSPDGEMVTTYEGLRLLPDYSFANAPQPDILIVPSAENSRDGDLGNAALIDYVRKAGSSARYVMSMCWGAFVLAEAGLLDGSAMTTFPTDYDTFLDRFPRHDLRVNVSFVHDRRAITSEGGAKSYDAAMYLVDLLYGEDAARGVGAGLLIPWPPEPAESRYLAIRPSRPERTDD